MAIFIPLGLVHRSYCERTDRCPRINSDCCPSCSFRNCCRYLLIVLGYISFRWSIPYSSSTSPTTSLRLPLPFHVGPNLFHWHRCRPIVLRSPLTLFHLASPPPRLTTAVDSTSRWNVCLSVENDSEGFEVSSDLEEINFTGCWVRLEAKDIGTDRVHRRLVFVYRGRTVFTTNNRSSATSPGSASLATIVNYNPSFSLISPFLSVHVNLDPSFPLLLHITRTAFHSLRLSPLYRASPSCFLRDQSLFRQNSTFNAFPALYGSGV